MYDIVDVWVLVEDGIEVLFIRYVAVVVFGPLAADELDAVQDFLGGVVEVVDDDDFVVGLEEGESGEGADVAGAAVHIMKTVSGCTCWSCLGCVQCGVSIEDG